MILARLIELLNCRPFRGRTGPEDQIAIEVANMLKAHSFEAKLKAVWTHIPHEVGAVSKSSQGFNTAQARYAKQKAMGLVTGSCDYVFVWPDGGGWIELKTSTGSLTPAQKLFRDWCVAKGVNHAVCRSCPEVEQKLIEWGALQL